MKYWMIGLVGLIAAIVFLILISFRYAAIPLPEFDTGDALRIYRVASDSDGLPSFNFEYPALLGYAASRQGYKNVEEIDFTPSGSTTPSLRIVFGIDTPVDNETFAEWIQTIYRQNESRRFFEIDGYPAFGQIDRGDVCNYGIDLGKSFLSFLVGGDSKFITERDSGGESTADKIMKSISFKTR